jgi:hypothetical protein
MNQLLTRTLPSLAVTATLALASHAANANLIDLGVVDLNGTGLGAVNTLLTMQSPGNTSDENGSISWSGSADVISGSNALTGSSQTRTRVLGDVGVLSADSLRIVFNASEPGNADNGITLNTLTFSAYTPTGVNIFSGSLAAPVSYANTFNGVGNSGFVFGLDAPQSAAFQAAVATSGFAFSSIVAGLSASASQATGGNETFFISSADGLTPPTGVVPEPQTYALLLAGLGAVGFVVKRRQR